MVIADLAEMEEWPKTELDFSPDVSISGDSHSSSHQYVSVEAQQELSSLTSASGVVGLFSSIHQEVVIYPNGVITSTELCIPCKTFYKENGFLSPDESCVACVKRIDNLNKQVVNLICTKCKSLKCHCTNEGGAESSSMILIPTDEVTPLPLKYECAYCTEKFATTLLLQKHTFIHSQGKTIEVLEEDSESLDCVASTSKGRLNVCCDFCNAPFLRQDHLEKHLSVHHKDMYCKLCKRAFIHLDPSRHSCKETKLTCNMCGAWFRSGYSLKMHLLKHAGSLPHKCEQCPKSFAKPSELTRHGSVHSIERPYVCPECGMSFSSSTNLKNHRNTHSGVRPYPCSICSKTFTRPADVKRHLLTHTGARPFACEICGLAFADASNLKKHMNTHSKSKSGQPSSHRHRTPGQKTYQCTLCLKHFSRPSELKRHFFTHTNIRPYPCDYCGLAFTDSSNLKKHVLTHVKQVEHRCPRCNETFDEFVQLEQHITAHKVEEQHVCPICSATFSHLSQLREHSVAHSASPGGFKCEVCSKTFCRESFLERHVSGHTEYRPYECKDCFKCFKSLSHLKNHTLVHTGRKDHVCQVCSKSFLKKSSLTRHSQNIHARHKAFPVYE